MKLNEIRKSALRLTVLLILLTTLVNCTGSRLSGLGLFSQSSASVGSSFPMPTQTNEIDTLPTIPTQELVNGLGFNVNPANSFEFNLAHNIGAIEVRIQPSWNAIEDMNGNFTMPAVFENDLTLMSTLGLQPLLLAAYGPLWATRGNVTVASTANVGIRKLWCKGQTRPFFLPSPLSMILLFPAAEIRSWAVILMEEV